MYSGSISSPRELQAMQADVEQLRRHQRALEDRELELMESQEPLDAELGGLEERVGELQAGADAARGRARRAGGGDRRGARRASSRPAARPRRGIPAEPAGALRAGPAASRGVGAARLVGNTCQGCRLTIPATEVDRIRKAGAEGDVVPLRQLRRHPRPDLVSRSAPARPIRRSTATAARGETRARPRSARSCSTSRSIRPRVFATVSERIGIATNNVAEYQALIAGSRPRAPFEPRAGRACGPTPS